MSGTIPYSLDIMPPSFICPPYFPHEFAADVYLSPIYAHPPASVTPTNERKVRTNRTILYMKSTYLLASDTPTKGLATWWQAGGVAKTGSRFLTAHTLRLH